MADFDYLHEKHYLAVVLNAVAPAGLARQDTWAASASKNRQRLQRPPDVTETRSVDLCAWKGAAGQFLDPPQTLWLCLQRGQETTLGLSVAAAHCTLAQVAREHRN